MSTNLKFLVIGNGFIFPKHEEAIKKIKGNIVDIVNGEQWWGNKIAETEADWVVILTPNFTHQQIIDVALSNGKKVICEKPLVLSSEEARKYIGKPVYTIHQLRYLPLGPFEHSENIDLNISVHRSADYFNSWKGNLKLSGGLLLNVGIHYFDLILHYFGEPISVKLDKFAEERAEGTLTGKDYHCHFLIDLLAPENKQERVLTVGGIRYELNSKENLHIKAYQDIINGRGLDAREAIKSIGLIEKLRQ